MGASSPEITILLKAWSNGDQAALARLAERVYPELRLMARRYMKNERQANTLQTTALVHEVYLRLVDVTKVDWRHRRQQDAYMCLDRLPEARELREKLRVQGLGGARIHQR